MKLVSASIRIFVLTIATITVLGAPSHAAAAACAGNAMVSGAVASVQSPTLLATSPSACTIMAQTGYPTNMLLACRIINSSKFSAQWASTAARQSSAGSNCAFTCPSGSCVLGSNGLPVELLHFGVE